MSLRSTCGIQLAVRQDCPSLYHSFSPQLFTTAFHHTPTTKENTMPTTSALATSAATITVPIYQVDAFASTVFRGNPAAVCPLDAWLPDATMQAIAAENNLAETAFFVARADGSYDLRWFTPEIEIPLCGHATLASAFVLYNHLGYNQDVVRFQSMSGELRVSRRATPHANNRTLLTLDFPARPLTPISFGNATESAPALASGLASGLASELASELVPELVSDIASMLAIPPASIVELYRSAMNYLVVLASPREVIELAPDFSGAAARRLKDDGIIATAAVPSSLTPEQAAAQVCDVTHFVSRYFAGFAGVPEDPVTGSAHCTLVPYWSERLGVSRLRAFQASKRGGDLWCEYVPPAALGDLSSESPSEGARVLIAGDALLYLQGNIIVPAK
jgi:predicted PhzF superfamily epimerase YddE/YHI9